MNKRVKHIDMPPDLNRVMRLAESGRLIEITWVVRGPDRSGHVYGLWVSPNSTGEWTSKLYGEPSSGHSRPGIVPIRDWFARHLPKTGSVTAMIWR